MDAQALSLLQQIVDELSNLNSTASEINQGIGMLLERSNAELLDKLDDIAGGIGDVKDKIPGDLKSTLTNIFSSLESLPAELRD